MQFAVYSGYLLVGSEGFEPPQLTRLIYSQLQLTALATAPEGKLFCCLRRSKWIVRDYYSGRFASCQAFFRSRSPFRGKDEGHHVNGASSNGETTGI